MPLLGGGADAVGGGTVDATAAAAAAAAVEGASSAPISPLPADAAPTPLRLRHKLFRCTRSILYGACDAARLREQGAEGVFIPQIVRSGFTNAVL